MHRLNRHTKAADRLAIVNSGCGAPRGAVPRCCVRKSDGALAVRRSIRVAGARQSGWTPRQAARSRGVPRACPGALVKSAEPAVDHPGVPARRLDAPATVKAVLAAKDCEVASSAIQVRAAVAPRRSKAASALWARRRRHRGRGRPDRSIFFCERPRIVRSIERSFELISVWTDPARAFGARVRGARDLAKPINVAQDELAILGAPAEVRDDAVARLLRDGTRRMRSSKRLRSACHRTEIRSPRVLVTEPRRSHGRSICAPRPTAPWPATPGRTNSRRPLPRNGSSNDRPIATRKSEPSLARS